MRRRLHWLDVMPTGRMSLSAKPRGGDWLYDDLKQWKRAGVQTIVSLLTPEEEIELALQIEAETVAKLRLEYLALAMPDLGVPEQWTDALALIDRLVVKMNRGESVLIHCRLGIGRTGIIAVGVLMRLGVPMADAIRRASIARELEVPESPAQREWLVQLDEKLKAEAANAAIASADASNELSIGANAGGAEMQKARETPRWRE